MTGQGAVTMINLAGQLLVVVSAGGLANSQMSPLALAGCNS
jgi:hypothetical protein